MREKIGGLSFFAFLFWRLDNLKKLIEMNN